MGVGLGFSAPTYGCDAVWSGFTGTDVLGLIGASVDPGCGREGV